MFQPIAPPTPRSRPSSVNPEVWSETLAPPLVASETTPAWLAFVGTAISPDSQNGNPGPTPELQEHFTEASAAYLQLRQVDKRSLFEALDQTATNASRRPLTPAETSNFITACRALHALEGQAENHVRRYAGAFRQLRILHQQGAPTAVEIDWLAGGRKNLAAPDALAAVERLIATEQMAKTTQLAVFGVELERVFRLDLPDNEKVIVARAAQRFLNAATLVLNSPLGGPAVANLLALQALVGCADRPAPAMPAGCQWTTESVRNLLIDRLEALVRHILEPAGKFGGLSEPATRALRQACRNVLEVVDAQGAFKVPQSWMATTGV